MTMYAVLQGIADFNDIDYDQLVYSLVGEDESAQSMFMVIVDRWSGIPNDSQKLGTKKDKEILSNIGIIYDEADKRYRPTRAFYQHIKALFHTADYQAEQALWKELGRLA